MINNKKKRRKNNKIKMISKNILWITYKEQYLRINIKMYLDRQQI